MCYGHFHDNSIKALLNTKLEATKYIPFCEASTGRCLSSSEQACPLLADECLLALPYICMQQGIVAHIISYIFCTQLDDFIPRESFPVICFRNESLRDDLFHKQIVVNSTAFPARQNATDGGNGLKKIKPPKKLSRSWCFVSSAFVWLLRAYCSLISLALVLCHARTFHAHTLAYVAADLGVRACYMCGIGLDHMQGHELGAVSCDTGQSGYALRLLHLSTKYVAPLQEYGTLCW